MDVHVLHGPIEVPPDIQAELDAWQVGGAESLELAERLAEEGEAEAKG